MKLEKFTPGDFHHYFELVGNADVMAMITARALGRDEAKRNYAKLIRRNQISPFFGSFKIIDAETNEFLGLAKLEITRQDSPEAELGYMLLPKHWGKGMATAASKYLIARAQAQKSIATLFAIIDPQNAASRKILTNNGFTSKEFKDFDGLPGEILELKLMNNPQRTYP